MLSLYGFKFNLCSARMLDSGQLHYLVQDLEGICFRVSTR